MSRELQIKILGPLQVTVGGETAVFRTDALRILLAYLAAHQGVPQRRDTLAGLLSPDRADKEALTYLRNRLTRLRDAIGDETAVPPYLDIDRKQIALRSGDDIVIDVMQFEQYLAAVETHPHRQLAGCPTCLAQLDTAVNLVRGELLAGLNFPSDTWEAWLLTQREHVQQRALEAMTLLREARMQLGDWTAVLDIAQRQLSLEPWLEAAHRALMLAHTHLGDRNAALAQYDRCKLLLWDELGVATEEETDRLRQQIFDDALLWDGTAVPVNLPSQTGLFFGREAEQAQLLQRLVDPNYRLITLIGTGGIGKTRLSLEVGKQIKTSFPDGVWFVPLDAIKGGAEQIKIAVGEAAGLGQAGHQLAGDQVLAILRDKQMLLIFDNCEVVLNELSFIPEWLRRAPQTAILATSREPLNFQEEAVIVLDGLPTGEGAVSTAEALFAERGQMARDGFVVSSENLAQVSHICELVDGSPLGIALAAAWVRRRSLKQIADEIGRSLDFLSTRMRDVDPRHRSMRAVFEASWQLLEAAEQAVLAALSVFPTTFTAVAAAEVAGAALLDLDLLCEKSLLQQQHEPERYVMHSLVRQFAADKLASRGTAVDRRFVDYFYQYAHEHQHDYAALQPEWRNFLAGITKAHALAAWPLVLDFVQVLDEPWFRQIRFNDMREGLVPALEAATALQDQPALAQVLLRLGEIEMELNDYAAAETYLEMGMQHLMQLEDGMGIAQGKYLNGRIKIEQGKSTAALTLLEDAKHIYEELDDPLGIAKSLNMVALYHLTYTSDLTTAHNSLEYSVSLLKQLPPSATYIEALRYLGRVKGILEAYEKAKECFIEAENMSHILQDLGEYGAILFEHIILCRRQNQIDAALSYAKICLEQFQKLGSLRWEALVNTQLAILHQAKQQHNLALSLFTESLAIFDELGDLYEQAYAHYYLYKLYAQMKEIEKSNHSKQQALILNAEIKDPQLAKRLA